MTGWNQGDSWLHYDYVHDISYVYVNIPKNASSWMKENFGGFKFDRINNLFLSEVSSIITAQRGLIAPKKYLVILRDPVSRWLSGFAQHFWEWDPLHIGHYAHQPADFWFQTVNFDEHTRPQIHFLHELDYENTIWFDCDANLIDNVKSWMAGKFDHKIEGLDNNLDNRYNVTDRTPGKYGVSKQQVIDHVQSVLDCNPAYKQKLLDFYQEDIALRKSVEFYGTR